MEKGIIARMPFRKVGSQSTNQSCLLGKVWYGGTVTYKGWGLFFSFQCEVSQWHTRKKKRQKDGRGKIQKIIQVKCMHMNPAKAISGKIQIHVHMLLPICTQAARS